MKKKLDCGMLIYSVLMTLLFLAEFDVPSDLLELPDPQATSPRAIAAVSERPSNDFICFLMFSVPPFF